jgi:uncharacterized protein YbjT (DUF2867 family)
MLPSMADTKLIAVVGATGAQGGGLVKGILEDAAGGFAVRAITRHPDGEKGAALAALGAEVVGADLDDAASVQRAFEGAYGAFCVTNFWEHFSVEREQQQATNLAQAAKGAGVQHAIWSTLEDTRRWVPLDDPRLPTLLGKYKVPHFDSKGEVDQRFRDLGVPTTFLLTSFYWDNFIYFGMGPTKGADGRYAITMPMGDRRLPGIAAEDIGRCTYGIFKQGLSLVGDTIGVAGEHLTGTQMATALSAALGVDIHYNDVPPDVYRRFGFPGAEDLGNMFQFNRDFDGVFRAAREPDVARRLYPGLQDFATWLARHASRIPLS